MDATNLRLDEALSRAANARATTRLTGEFESLGDGFLLARRDPVAEAARLGAAAAAGARHPFLEPEEELRTPLFERSVGRGIFSLIINKYPIVDPHLLLVRAEARRYQTDPLTSDDLLVATRLAASTNGVAFFNSGRASGASMPHKHIQLFPRAARAELEVAAAGPLACDRMVADAARPSGCAPFSLPALDGLDHACVALPPVAPVSDGADTAAGDQLLRAYHAAMGAAGLGAVARSAGGTDRMRDEGYEGYNLVLTCDWLLVVARSRSHAWGGALNVNAAGFIGVLMPNDDDERSRARLRERGGALAALRDVCRPASGNRGAGGPPEPDH